MPVPVPDTISLTNVLLTTTIFLYSLSHLVLVLLSSLAWTTAHRFVNSPACWEPRIPHNDTFPLSSNAAEAVPRAYCGFTRWGLYFCISVAALICFLTTAVVVFNTLCRSPIGRRSGGLHPEYLLRCVLITVALVAPLVYIGWQDVTVIAPEPVEAHMHDFSSNTTIKPASSFEGLSGVFILELMDKSSPVTNAAFILTHFNLAFGALLARILAAIAVPPKGHSTTSTSGPQSGARSGYDHISSGV